MLFQSRSQAGIAVNNFCAFIEGQPHHRLAERFAHFLVHLVIDEPHRDLRDARGPFFDLDSVHLIHIHL